MDEVIDEALRHLSRQSGEHHITVEQSEEFLLAKMDSRLIVQVVFNLVDNAVKYTPPVPLSTYPPGSRRERSV